MVKELFPCESNPLTRVKVWLSHKSGSCGVNVPTTYPTGEFSGREVFESQMKVGVALLPFPTCQFSPISEVFPLLSVALSEIKSFVVTVALMVVEKRNMPFDAVVPLTLPINCSPAPKVEEVCVELL